MEFTKYLNVNAFLITCNETPDEGSYVRRVIDLIMLSMLA